MCSEGQIQKVLSQTYSRKEGESMGKSKIYGYGEDSLTLRKLTKDLDGVLRELKDESSPEQCLVLYRPSFGRGRGGVFGEFDAILATPRAIYLIESKWVRQSLKNGLRIRKEQMLRHTIFQEYYKELKDWEFPDCEGDEVQEKWESFRKKKKNIRVGGDSKKIPTINHTLAKNILYVMWKLQQFGKKERIKNVLILFGSRELTNSVPNSIDGFEIVLKIDDRECSKGWVELP